MKCHTVILDMSFCIILTEDNAFLESLMNNISPCLLPQQVTICCPLQSIMHLSSDAHIYISCFSVFPISVAVNKRKIIVFCAVLHVLG